MKKLIITTAMLMAACATVDEARERPVLNTGNFAGNHAELALCVTKRLQADSRWPVRMLQFRNRTYQTIDASEIIAYDVRLMPGTFARNIPTNPDAVLDYQAYPELEVLHAYDESTDAYTQPAYRFSLMIRETDAASVTATVKGSRHLGNIAWQHLQACS